METILKVKRKPFKTPCLPSHNIREADVNKTFQTYCVKLESLDSIDQVPDSDSFHLQAILFDQKYKRFVGPCSKGKPGSVKNNKVYFNQSFYFYTSIPGPHLVLVVELSTTSRSVAWMCVPLVESDESAAILEHSVSYKIPLLHGSPLALIVLNGDPKGFALLDHTTGVEMSLSLMPYPLVLQIAHLIPENVLLDASDVIPGLVQDPGTTLSGVGYSFKPHLQKCITYVLAGLCIRIQPSVEDFERTILEKILKQQQDSGFTDMAASKAHIIQRRLQVGVHNSYSFIQECDLYHLLVEPIVTPKAQKTHQRSSSMGSINYSRETGLTLRSDVKMPNVPDDSNITFVFLVEYTISLPSTAGGFSDVSNSISRSPTSSVAVAWGHCKLENLRMNPLQTVPLTCDSTGSPFGLLFLRMPNVLELSFTMSTLQKQNRNISSGHSVGDYDSVASFSTKTYASPETSYLHSPTISIPAPKHKSVGDIPVCVAQNEAGSQKFQELENNNLNLQEVTLISSSLPLVPPMLHSFPVESLSSSKTFTKLYWYQLEVVLDHRGKPATVLELPYTINKQLELSSPPQQNECAMQFLALSSLEDSSQVPSDVFFTFQFYRFLPVRTESLVLKPLPENEEGPLSTSVFALMKFQNPEESPGFQITYKVDPSEMGSEEYKPFLQYLMKQSLHIDLWNGQSLLYFGTVLLPLKYFCRQGKDAVSVTLELDIVDCEFPDESLGQASSSPPAVRKGKLHMHLSCIRHPLTAKCLEKLEGNLNGESVIIFPKNTPKASAPTVSRARPVIETNRELTHLLASRGITKDKSLYMSEERRRKLARMEAVLNLENKGQNNPSMNDNLNHFLKEREQDMLTIESYVRRNKLEMIESLLHASVTQERTIYPVIGSKTFFEFVLENPFQESKKVNISWKFPELSLVTDLKMWKVLRNLHSISQKVDPIELRGTSLTLSPKERVNVPFTYYSSALTHCQQLEVFKTSSGHHFTSDMLSSSPVSRYLMANTIKIRFVTEEQVLLALLILYVQPLPPSPTHVFKFLSMEHSMFKKCIRVDRGTSGRLSTCCSDSEATCCMQEGWEEDIGIHVKAPTQSSGRLKEFFLFLYQDVLHHQIYPFQVWHITICPLQRVDLSCVSGQLVRSSLLIRGSHVTHLVRCFSSSPNLRLHPGDSFLLAPFSPQELSLNVRPLLPGTRHFQITMVNQSLELVLQSWLLVLSCLKPSISKAFQVHLGVGKDVIKRITYTNPYNQERHFVLYSSHPHLLRLKDVRFRVGAAQSHPLCLHFLRQENIFTETLFLYMNDEGDKNEETYCIKVICQ